MPTTQAYSVSWTVTIQPEGDVSQDVAEITVIEEDDKPDSATVVLDTSERPHALEEQEIIDIQISDGNDTITFDGITDSVKDDEEQPIVTIDARESDGLLQDTTAAGSISASNLFRVIEAIVDGSAGQVREVSFDPSSLESTYGTFASSTDFAGFDISYSGDFGVATESLDQHETASEEREAEVRFDSYSNNTGNTYVCDITGEDGAGNTVTASFDLPPGTDAQDAYGTDSFKLAPSGGNEKFVKVTGIDTNVPNLLSGFEVLVSGSIWNYVKTDWDFKLDTETSVKEAISRVVRYISGLDSANDWEFYVDDTDTLVVQPSSTGTPDRYVFREGDNVLKPVASRDLDGVRNFIKVSGAGDVNAWHWAYNGELQSWIVDNPFEDGTYPDSGVIFGSGQAEQNHIDKINLRGKALSGDNITSSRQAIDIGQKALKEYLRTPVSGQAPVPGVHPASPGDEAEVYYPSRGIPSKVANNVFDVKKVEYSITPEEAKTTIDFGTSKPNLGDVIESGGGLVRSDISNSIAQFGGDDAAAGGGTGDGLLIVGTLDVQNSDGTWQVKGEDGEKYSDVRVI